MNEDRKRGAQDKRVTKTEYEVALWKAHIDRLRANAAYCREPGEDIPSSSDYLEPCESGDSFHEEMKKLSAAGDRAFHDASLRVQKRVEALEEMKAHIRELKISYLKEHLRYLDDFGKLDPADPQYNAKRKSLVQKIKQVHEAYSALGPLSKHRRRCRQGNNMVKIKEPSKKFLLNLPVSHKERLEMLMIGRFDHLSEYLRYLVRQEIQRHGTPPAAGGPSNDALSTVGMKSMPDCADIRVDGKFVGNTPSSVRLVPGDHKITIEKSGFKPWERTVTVSPGAAVTISPTLEKLPNPVSSESA